MRRSVTFATLVITLTVILTFSPGTSEVQASALQAALDGPMGFVETDIQLSADGVPVLMHDSFVNRTTNGSGRVSEMTLAQLQKLDAGAWFSPEFAGTRIPTLETLLIALVATQDTKFPKKALLELKGFWTVPEVQIVVDQITSYELNRQVVLTSFDSSTLQHLAEVDETIPRAIITRELPNDPVGYAHLYGAIAIITSQASVVADPWAVDRMHRAGLGLVLYTLNTKAKWKEAMGLGVDGIITDRPNRLENWFAAASK